MRDLQELVTVCWAVSNPGADTGHHRLCWSPQVMLVTTGYAGHYTLCWSPQVTLVTAGYAGHHRLCWSPQVMLVTAGYAGHHRLCCHWCWEQRQETLFKSQEWPGPTCPHSLSKCQGHYCCVSEYEHAVAPMMLRVQLQQNIFKSSRQKAVVIVQATKGSWDTPLLAFVVRWNRCECWSCIAGVRRHDPGAASSRHGGAV